MRKATSAELWSHRMKCFGRGKKRLRQEGPCPPSCRKLCARFRFDDSKAPRVVGRRKDRSFTQIPNKLLGKWPRKHELTAKVKLVYLHLVSRTTPTNRIVTTSAREMADDMGITHRAFCEHVRVLRNRALIDVVPMRALHLYGDSARNAFVMLDLPDVLIEVRGADRTYEPGNDVGECDEARDDDDDHDDVEADDDDHDLEDDEG